MSAGLPYVAPWEAGFTRYSTQIIDLPLTGAAGATLVVPEGQWWRIIYLQSAWSASAVVANRSLEIAVNDPKNVRVLLLMPALNLTASAAIYHVWAPGVNAFGLPAATVAGFSQMPLPDMLWGPGYSFNMFLQNVQVGDTSNTPQKVAVEVYDRAAAESSHVPLAPITF